MERKGNRSTIYIGRTRLHGCLLGLLSSHSLAQNDYGHISNMPADHVRRGKGWMLRVDAVAVADGDRIYTKHPPLPPADVIRRDVRDVATVVLCERV